jgi:hypothetical protein
MMKKRLVAISVIVISLWSLSAVWQPAVAQEGRRHPGRNKAQAADRWQTFTGPDGDFTLAFPQKPNREPDTQGVVTIIRAYSVTTESGMHFSVNFQDLGGDPRARRNNEYDQSAEEMMADAARDQGQRVVQIHRIARNIIETELWQTLPETGNNINYVTRNIVRRGRVYTLGCGSVINNQEVNKTICQRFFNSVRFTR